MTQPTNEYSTVHVDCLVENIGSSLVDAVAYGIAERSLFVNLHGRVYKYYGVEADVFNDLVAAGSPGQYYSDNIRGKYTSEFFDDGDDFSFSVAESSWLTPAVVPDVPWVRTLDQGLGYEHSYLVTYLETETVVTKVDHPREVKVFASTIEDAIERASGMIEADEIEAVLTSIKVDLTV